MRVVLDTCVLYAALDSRDGASFFLLSQITHGRYEPVITAPVLFEYEDVLCRPNQFEGIDRDEIENVLNVIVRFSHHAKVSFLWRPTLPDPNDDMLLEAAVSGQAGIIVTFNLKHFVGSDKFGIRVLTPRDFIKEISK